MIEAKYFELVGRYSSEINNLEWSTKTFLRNALGRTHDFSFGNSINEIKKENVDSGLNSKELDDLCEEIRKEKDWRNVIFHQVGVANIDPDTNLVLSFEYVNWATHERRTASAYMIEIHIADVEVSRKGMLILMPLSEEIHKLKTRKSSN